MRVIHFERMPRPDAYSIERLFGELRRVVGARCKVKVEVVRCETPYHSRWWLLKGVIRAYRTKAGGIDIVGEVHYVALGLPGRNTILTVLDLNHLDDLRGVKKVLYRWLYFAWPLRRCRFVTVVSEHTRERLEQVFPFVRGRVEVIACCIPAGFEASPRKFHADGARVLQVGTAPNKNLERVIEALKGLPCELHIIGRLSEMQRRLLADAQVRYQNSVNLSDEEVIQAYKEADLVVFVSLAEGFGMPIIEANAVGRPVVTSNLSPMKEVAGKAACLVDPRSPTSIREGIQRVLTDEQYRESLIQQGYVNAGRYRAETVAGQYARLYEKVAAGRH